MIYKVIGLMSGTSLDGLDIAYAEFEKKSSGWNFEIIQSETVEYSSIEKKLFQTAIDMSGAELAKFHCDFGNYLGRETKKFIDHYKIQTHFISSHGHTIFHQPQNGFTLQIGSGANIHAITNIPVVCDFRSVDVAFHGQGAPLVPIGDRELFPQYGMCLNLGGFANISFFANGKVTAFDICPVNIVLNTLAGELGLPYDEDGKISQGGTTDHALLQSLNRLSYYAQPYPKSLGREWVDEHIFPLLTQSNISTTDKLHTFSRHISQQITSAIKTLSSGTKVLVSGGGAFNGYLMHLLQTESDNVVFELPQKNIIMYKEALIFAFLGILKLRNENNSLKMITGAEADNMGGALYGPHPYLNSLKSL